MKLTDLYKQILLENNTPNEFGCVMLYVDFEKFEDIQSFIEEEDIDEEEKLEHEPHITLLYGLHEEATLEDIKKVLNDFTFPKLITAYDVSLFENEKYDVLKLSIKDTKYLSKINKELAKLPHTNTFSNYTPHLTIGYLKSGTGKKYVKMFKNKEYELKSKHVVYSTKDGIKTKIKILVQSK